MGSAERLIAIKDIVERYDIPYSTINHYTIIGLLSVAGRKKNVRLYDADDVANRLKKIDELRSKGYPLLLIQEELGRRGL